MLREGVYPYEYMDDWENIKWMMANLWLIDERMYVWMMNVWLMNEECMNGGEFINY